MKMYYLVYYSPDKEDFASRMISFNHSDSVIDFLVSNTVFDVHIFRVFPHKGSLPTISSLGKCKLKDRVKELGINVTQFIGQAFWVGLWAFRK